MARKKEPGNTGDIHPESFPIEGNMIVSPYPDHSDPPWSELKHYYYDIIDYFNNTANKLGKEPPEKWAKNLEAGQIFYDYRGAPIDIRLTYVSTEPYDGVREDDIEHIYEFKEKFNDPWCKPKLTLYRWYTNPSPKLELTVEKSWNIRPFPEDIKKSHYSIYIFGYPGFVSKDFRPNIAPGKMITSWDFTKVRDFSFVPPLPNFMTIRAAFDKNIEILTEEITQTLGKGKVSPLEKDSNFYDIVSYIETLTEQFGQSPPKGWPHIIDSAQIFYNNKGEPVDIRIKCTSCDYYEGLMAQDCDPLFDLNDENKSPEITLCYWHTKNPPRFQLRTKPDLSLDLAPFEALLNHYSLYFFFNIEIDDLGNPHFVPGELIASWSFGSIRNFNVVPPLPKNNKKYTLPYYYFTGEKKALIELYRPDLLPASKEEAAERGGYSVLSETRFCHGADYYFNASIYSLAKIVEIANHEEIIITPRTIRYYQTEGLLPKPKITKKNSGAYSLETISILKIIEKLKKKGMKLGEIRLELQKKVLITPYQI